MLKLFNRNTIAVIITAMVFYLSFQLGVAYFKVQEINQEIGSVQILQGIEPTSYDDIERWLNKGYGAALYGWESKLGEATTGIVSPRWFSLVMPLEAGRLPRTKDEVVAQVGGPYSLGLQVGHQKVVGLARAPLWEAYSDTVLFRLFPETLEFKLLVAENEISRKELTLHDSMSWQNVSNLVVGQTGMWAVLRALKLQLLILMALLLLSVYSISRNIKTTWILNRENYRIMRVLGMSRSEMERLWYTEVGRYWISHVLVSIALSILAISISQIIKYNSDIRLGWITLSISILTVLIFLSIMSVGLIKSESGFPLSRINMTSKNNRWDRITLFIAIPLAISFISLASLDIFNEYTKSKNYLIETGINRVSISGIRANNELLNINDCNLLLDNLSNYIESCGLYFTGGIPVIIEGNITRDYDDFLFFDDSLKNELELSEGRWPTSKEEVIVSPELAQYMDNEPLGKIIKLNSRGDINEKLKVVGVGKDVAEDIELNASIYLSTKSNLFDSPDEYRDSGLIIRIKNIDIINNVFKEKIRNILDKKVDIYFPAAIAIKWHKSQVSIINTLIISIALSLLLIFNLFKSILIQEIEINKSYYNLLRDIGASKKFLMNTMISVLLFPILCSVLLSVFLSLKIGIWSLFTPQWLLINLFITLLIYITSYLAARESIKGLTNERKR